MWGAGRPARFSIDAALDDDGSGAGKKKIVWFFERDRHLIMDGYGNHRLGDWRVKRSIVEETMAVTQGIHPYPLYRLSDLRVFSEDKLYATKEEAERALHEMLESFSLYDESGRLKDSAKESSKAIAKDAVKREAARIKAM